MYRGLGLGSLVRESLKGHICILFARKKIIRKKLKKSYRLLTI
jgi:hypothetical protein